MFVCLFVYLFACLFSFVCSLFCSSSLIFNVCVSSAFCLFRLFLWLFIYFSLFASCFPLAFYLFIYVCLFFRSCACLFVSLRSLICFIHDFVFLLLYVLPFACICVFVFSKHNATVLKVFIIKLMNWNNNNNGLIAFLVWLFCCFIISAASEENGNSICNRSGCGNGNMDQQTCLVSLRCTYTSNVLLSSVTFSAPHFF